MSNAVYHKYGLAIFISLLGSSSGRWLSIGWAEVDTQRQDDWPLLTLPPVDGFLRAVASGKSGFALESSSGTAPCVATLLVWCKSKRRPREKT